MEVNYMDIHKKMQHNSISLTFKGSVTFELIDSIIAIIKYAKESIFANADFGIVGEYADILPVLIKEVKNGFVFGLDKDK